MVGKVNTPERVAFKEFNNKCLQACSQFYRDQPTKDLKKGCDIIEEELFMGSTPVKCRVKEGQNKFPTQQEYIRDALLNAPQIVIDRRREHVYRDLLSDVPEDLERFNERINAGEIQLTDVGRPIGYWTFRQGKRLEDALFDFARTNKPSLTQNQFNTALDNVCSSPEYGEASSRKKASMLRIALRENAFAKRDIDAKRMSEDIIKVIPICKVAKE